MQPCLLLHAMTVTQRLRGWSTLPRRCRLQLRASLCCIRPGAPAAAGSSGEGVPQAAAAYAPGRCEGLHRA